MPKGPSGNSINVEVDRMKPLWRWMLVCCVLTVIVMAMPLPKVKAQENTQEPAAQCCYVHPNYNGVCIVTPVDDETCESILDYLNTPNTVGKTYCGNTVIRGGWEQVTCQE